MAVRQKSKDNQTDLIFLPHINTINKTHAHKHTLTMTTLKDLQYHMHTNWTKCRQCFNHITVNIRDNEGLIFIFERYAVAVIKAYCYIYLPAWSVAMASYAGKHLLSIYLKVGNLLHLPWTTIALWR